VAQVLREGDAAERLASHQRENVAGPPNDDSWLKRELRQDLAADRRRGRLASDDERADGADIRHVQMRKIRRQPCGAEDVPASDVGRAEKDDVGPGASVVSRASPRSPVQERRPLAALFLEMRFGVSIALLAPGFARSVTLLPALIAFGRACRG